MATKKERKADAKNFMVCNIADSTYTLHSNTTIDVIAKELNADPGTVIGIAPKYQAFVVPKRVINLF